jgi:hypothetical protein
MEIHLEFFMGKSIQFLFQNLDLKALNDEKIYHALNIHFNLRELEQKS